MEILPPKKIKIVDTPGKGRGVIALEDIKKDEVIETVPIIFISDAEVEMIEKLSDVLKYYYLWQTSTNKYVIMLGYGSMYNHSKTPNADIDYETVNSKNYLIFEALRDIKAGEEIVFDYEFDDDKEEFLKLD